MIRVEKTHLPVAALTHPGMKGKNNEDRFGVAAFRTNSKPSTPVLLAILSDGIGGHRAGEIASELAVNVISHYAADSDGQNPLHILEQAITHASQAIHHQAQENQEQAGMGATCACVWISSDRLYTATVGDSRIYLMRRDKIHQISTDHTWIQEALDQGLIKPNQINGHPNAHVIRRYLGSPVPPEVDFRLRVPGAEGDANQGLYLLPGDRVLLCSDGLTDLVENQEILTEFLNKTLEDAGQSLIDIANQRGGHDNITLVAIQIPEPEPAPAKKSAGWLPAFSPRALAASCLGIIAVAVFAGVVAGGWLLYEGRLHPTPTALPVEEILDVKYTDSPVPQYSPTATRTKRATSTLRMTTATTTTTPTPTTRPESLVTVTPIRLKSPTPGLPVVTTTK